jgi:putative endonuclease
LPAREPPAAWRARAGRIAEDMAAAELERRGATVVLRNFSRRTGELDIVAIERGTLVVTEVRLRSRTDFGGAAASIDARKQLRIVRTTRQLLQLRQDLARLPVRFDVALVAPGTATEAPWTLEWIAQAFDARGG